MVPPGWSRPRRSASLMMLSATRSFIEPPGFRYSIFTKMSDLTCAATLLSRTIGVWPIASTTFFTAPFIMFVSVGTAGSARLLLVVVGRGGGLRGGLLVLEAGELVVALAEQVLHCNIL